MKKSYRTLDQAKLKSKKVILRAGFDVPMEEGKVVDPSRIEAILPTMNHILEAGAALIIIAHQGRPEGKPDPAFSQKPLVPVLKKLLKVEIAFAPSCVGSEVRKAASILKPGQVLLLENLRFDEREKKNDRAFAKELAALGDCYVNDAFSNCHREHASMVALAKELPSFMGLRLQEEVRQLSTVLDDPRHPVCLIVSGAKMKTKIPVIESFLSKGDDILLGGCISNTFIAARGFDVGMSKYEEEFVDIAQEIMLESEKSGSAMVHVPRDVVVASEPSEKATKLDLPVEDIEGDMAIYDIGQVSIKRYVEMIERAGTIIWNGPLGLYEYNRFSHATKRVAEAIARASKKGAISIIGGGDTLDFHKRYNFPLDVYTFASTGGGAMLDFIAGKKLPALEVLRN